MSSTMQRRRGGYRRSGLSVASSSTTNNAGLVSGGRAAAASSVCALNQSPCKRPARKTGNSMASKRNSRPSRTVGTRRHSDYSLPGDNGDDEQHIGDHRFYSPYGSIIITINNANDNDVVGSILDSIDHMESQMDPVCDDARRFSGHVPATGSANQWRHRRGWGRAEPQEQQQPQEQQRQQQPQHTEGDITMSQQSQHVVQYDYQQGNKSYGAAVPLGSGQNEQQPRTAMNHYRGATVPLGSGQNEQQPRTAMNPYQSKGSVLHTVANLMLLFSGFIIALTLLERFCADWLAIGLPWW